MKRRYFFLAFAVLSVALLSGCGGSSPVIGGGTPENTLVGSWRQTSVADETRKVNCPGFVNFPDGTKNGCGRDVLNFRNGGMMDGTKGAVPFTGVYTLNGDTLTRTINGVSDSCVIDLYAPENLSITYTRDGKRFHEYYHK